MNMFYICKFVNHPDVMKTGVSITNNKRIKEHLKTWGELTEDSIWYELPSTYHLYQLERTLKRIYKPSREKNKLQLESNDGYTEFISVEHFEPIKQFIASYICIGESEEYLPIRGAYKFDFLITDEIECKDIEIITEELGSHIRNLRLQDNITQGELASIIDVSIPTIKKLEAGENVTVDVLIKILMYFDSIQWVDSLSDKAMSTFTRKNERTKRIRKTTN